jgi:hypothetical protein
MQPNVSDVSLRNVVNFGIDRVVLCVQTITRFVTIFRNCCEFECCKSGYCVCNSK